MKQMTKLILIDEYWNELEQINLFSYDDDTQYIHVDADVVEDISTPTRLLLEKNDLELLYNE